MITFEIALFEQNNIKRSSNVVVLIVGHTDTNVSGMCSVYEERKDDKLSCIDTSYNCQSFDIE